jgi:hypothetical protein
VVRNRHESDEDVKAISEYYLEQTEAGLEEDVKHYWQLTRQGPHGDCDCHWMYVEALRSAIRRLRAFRKGVYWV